MLPVRPLYSSGETSVKMISNSNPRDLRKCWIPDIIFWLFGTVIILTETPIANEMGGMHSLWVVCGLEEGKT